jgi:hypothetical protein
VTIASFLEFGLGLDLQFEAWPGFGVRGLDMSVGGGDVESGIQIVLQVATIVVLIFTWRAALKQAAAAEKQAAAAEKLIVATEQQIKTGAEQAAAAKEQVAVAKRQVTESLRPILTCHAGTSTAGASGVSGINVDVRNEGEGVALDVWWTYGKPGINPSQRNFVREGILPPRIDRSFRAQESRAVHEGLVVVYESLSGIASASHLEWSGSDWVFQYYPDVTEWTRTLLGKPLGPTK